MAETSKADGAWLTIIGLGEDGVDGLNSAARAALEAAEIIMGPPRHLDLLTGLTAKIVTWPVPFSDGLPVLEGFRGQHVVVLASGDPFWFGAGSVIAHAFERAEWKAIPGPSTFALAAARTGWPLETTVCLGLHAAPMARLRPHLAPGQRLILLLRDGAAVLDTARYISDAGFGDSAVSVLEALGGPRERITTARADALTGDFAHPVALAVEVAGPGRALPHSSGIEDDFFETEGQITKRPMRALALSALAPRPHEVLWDIGGGSGSIAIEWLLAHPLTHAITIEPREERAALITRNAARLGVDRLQIVLGHAPVALEGLVPPDAVFIGGGLSEMLLVDLQNRLAPGTRLVAHAVTLESEALLTSWSARLGGEILRIELSQAAPLGPKRGWKAKYPVVQWRVTL